MVLLDRVTIACGGLIKEYFLINLLIGCTFGIYSKFIFGNFLEKKSKPLIDIFVLKAIIILNIIIYPYAKLLYRYTWNFMLGDKFHMYSLSPITIYFLIGYKGTLRLC